jgi:hypothetical protein
MFCMAMTSPAEAQVSDRDWFPGTSSIREPERIPPAYRGTWAPDASACRDQDGVTTFQVYADGIDTYESGGRLERVTQAGQERSIRLKFAYEGEGGFWERVETWTLDERGDRLTVSDDELQNPVVFVRC